MIRWQRPNASEISNRILCIDMQLSRGNGLLEVLFLFDEVSIISSFVGGLRPRSMIASSSLSIAPPLTCHIMSLRGRMHICTNNPFDKETAIVLWIKIRNYVNVQVGTCTAYFSATYLPTFEFVLLIESFCWKAHGLRTYWRLPCLVRSVSGGTCTSTGWRFRSCTLVWLTEFWDVPPSCWGSR